MKTLRLLQTTLFRLSVANMAAFAASAGVLLLFIHNATVAFIDRETNATIEADYRGLAEQYAQLGLSGLARVISERLNGDTQSGDLYLLIDLYHRPLAGNLALWPTVDSKADEWIQFGVEIPEASGPVMHAARAKIFDLADSHRLLVGRDIEDRVDFQGTLTVFLVASLAIFVVLSGIGGILTGRNILGRVDAIARTTHSIIRGDLSQRLPMQGIGDEFDRVAESVNQMLNQIEHLSKGMRTVIDSVAHDLRGPITRLRSHVELTFSNPPSIDSYRQALDTALTETERLHHTVNTLLHIAQAEAGTLAIEMERVDLSAVARDVADLYQPLAEERGLRLSMDATANIHILGHRELLSHAVANLIDNAIKYTPPGGAIGLTVSAVGPRATVTVADTGPGVSPEDRERVLQRFVRLEASRTTSGSGLGLSLVAAVAQLHEAELRLSDNTPGLRIEVIFRTAV
ncbi:MAG: HAMP domain-containing protein [Gammaproteobacteria bacterium]|nr:HAMP domain-containing protein [Gammaproteobacteria bacterium]